MACSVIDRTEKNPLRNGRDLQSFGRAEGGATEKWSEHTQLSADRKTKPLNNRRYS